MKVLLICLIVTSGCFADEKLNATTTSTLEKPFEPLKLQQQTQPTLGSVTYNVTTPPTENKNVTEEKQTIFQKKPFVKVRKIKKIFKNYLNNDNNYDVQKEKLDKEKSQFTLKYSNFPPFLNLPESQLKDNRTLYKISENPEEEPIKDSNSQKKESRVSVKYIFPDNIFEESRNIENFHIEKTKPKNSWRGQETHYEKTRIHPESRNKQTRAKYSYNIEHQPEESKKIHSTQSHKLSKHQKRGGRPSLPEIQNVIQTLDGQNHNDVYQSPKQNHIVEVNKVPLVFEHHYEGDYKNPQTKFVTHQYSYSPPADHSDEAYQLGKILSQNVVQKLHSSQKPLKEFVEGHQEVVLSRPSYQTSNFQQQTYVVPHLKTSSLPSHQFSHPLLRYLAPEISHSQYSQEIPQFETVDLNPYQLFIPKSQMQPIVVEEQESKPEYETTYLQAVSGPSNYHQISTNQHYKPGSPYSVNVQQQFMEVPKYTTVTYLSLQNNNPKPQAIHEVDPPNLSSSKNFKNIHYIRNHAPVLPTALPDYVRNPMHTPVTSTPLPPQYETSQVQDVENLSSKLRLGDIISNPELLHIMVAQPTPSSNFGPPRNHHATPLMLSRPYWRKPHAMKLVRVAPHQSHEQNDQYHQPQQHNYQTQQQNYQSQQQNYQPQEENYQQIQEFEADPYPGDSQTNYQSIQGQFSVSNINLVNAHEEQTHQESPAHYTSNVMRLVPQEQVEPVNVVSQYADAPLQVQGMYVVGQDQPADKPEEVYYTPNSYRNLGGEDNQNQYQSGNENRYPNEHNSNGQQTIQGEVEIVKSVSPEYFERPESHLNSHANSIHNKPMTSEQTHNGVELPKGYLAIRSQRNNLRTPHMNKLSNTRHIMPLAKQRTRDTTFNLKEKILYPRLRRLASNLMGENGRQSNYIVLVREEDEDR